LHQGSRARGANNNPVIFEARLTRALKNAGADLTVLLQNQIAGLLEQHDQIWHWREASESTYHDQQNEERSKVTLTTRQ
jgi:hypothetical protein